MTQKAEDNGILELGKLVAGYGMLLATFASADAYLGDFEPDGNREKSSANFTMPQNPPGQTLTGNGQDRYNADNMSTTLLAPKPETIGRKIADRRRELGLSQEELAEGTGLARATINRFEKGHREPRIRDASRIASFLRIRTAHLLSSV